MRWDYYQCIQFERRQRVLGIKLNRLGQKAAVLCAWQRETLRQVTGVSLVPVSRLELRKFAGQFHEKPYHRQP